MDVFVVMRSHNDMPIIGETLAKLHSQTQTFTLVVFDNKSTDGTLAEVKKYTNRVFDVIEYIPGRVLNQGMSNTSGEIVVFLNSDCTLVDDKCLERLLDAFTDDTVAGAFGRQVPRPGCSPLQVKDTEFTYGDGSRQSRWRNCFSMAWSAIRRSVWIDMPFDENLCIAEDIDWTYRARLRGYEIKYVPDSAVFHSHNYTVRQFYGRQFKEGRDDALIFEWSSWRASLFRYSLLPFARQVLSDQKYFLSSWQFGAALTSPGWRMIQLVARRRGFERGLGEGSDGTKSF